MNTQVGSRPKAQPSGSPAFASEQSARADAAGLTEPGALQRTSGRHWAFRVSAASIFMVLIALMAMSELGTQAAARQGIENRFATRGTSAAGFVQSYTSFLLDQERSLAEQQLAGKSVSHAQLHTFLAAFGFGPSVLLDASGHALDVAPYKASLIGTDIGKKYSHLTSALAGSPAVSNVVASAAQGIPIVAFATPFDTPYGRRVVSGAFNLATQPMGIYMKHVLPFAEGVAYMIDAKGIVVAASTNATGALAKVDPALALASADVVTGSYHPSHGGARRFAITPVSGTPWRIVQTLPHTILFVSITTSDRTLPWLFLVAFALAGGSLLVMFIRHREGRAHANRDARTDALTGIANRRSVQESLNRLLADRRRHSTKEGVLMIDVDHFKGVNDQHGHDGGDAVLREVVARISSCLRANDQIGRWGGEEFVVLLPNTDFEGVSIVAERIRLRVAEHPIAIKRAGIDVTISIGAVLATTEDNIDTVILHADAALYTAKNTGRNRCVVARAV